MTSYRLKNDQLKLSIFQCQDFHEMPSDDHLLSTMSAYSINFYFNFLYFFVEFQVFLQNIKNDQLKNPSLEC